MIMLICIVTRSRSAKRPPGRPLRATGRSQQAHQRQQSSSQATCCSSAIAGKAATAFAATRKARIAQCSHGLPWCGQCKACIVMLQRAPGCPACWYISFIDSNIDSLLGLGPQDRSHDHALGGTLALTAMACGEQKCRILMECVDPQWTDRPADGHFRLRLHGRACDSLVDGRSSGICKHQVAHTADMPASRRCNAMLLAPLLLPCVRVFCSASASWSFRRGFNCGGSWTSPTCGHGAITKQETGSALCQSRARSARSSATDMTLLVDLSP